MRVFHRHLLKTFLRNFLRTLAVLTAIGVVYGLPEVAAILPDASLPWGKSLLLSLRFVVLGLDHLLPLALLLATLFTVGQLARYQELAALGTAGWSMLQIMRPLIGVATVAVVYAVALRLPGSLVVPNADFEAERYAAWAYPWTNLFAVLTGIILASSPRRSSIFAGFGSALFVFIVYQVVIRTALLVGKHGMLPPFVAGWLGSVLFALAIFIAWRRMRQ